MIGVNSMIVKEFNPSGIVSASEVKLIELSLADYDFTKNGFVRRALRVKENYDVEYSIHAPFQNSTIKHLRVNFAELKPENFKVMEKVLEVCDMIDARRIVIHAGDVIGTLERSLRNVVKNLRELCKNRDYEFALENLYTENGVRRVCETPDEILFVLENVDADNLVVNLDVGHAYLASKQHEFQPNEFLEKLDGFIKHMHIHNNYGIRDDHNPPVRGLIDVRKFRCNADFKIVEVKNGTREELFRSMAMLF